MRIMTPNHQYPTNASVCLPVRLLPNLVPPNIFISLLLLMNLFSPFSAPFSPFFAPFSLSPHPAALSHFPHSRCAAVRGTDDSKIWENCVTH